MTPNKEGSDAGETDVEDTGEGRTDQTRTQAGTDEEKRQINVRQVQEGQKKWTDETITDEMQTQ